MRKSTFDLRILLCLAVISISLFTAAFGDDWPAWRGKLRDGICRETGLLKEWPDGGPKLIWKATGIGAGYSSPAVVGNTIYISGQNDGKQFVFALNASKEGKLIWSSDFAPVGNGGNAFPGSRSMPTVDGDRLYVIGISGELVCMDVKDGKIIWRKDFVKDFGSTVPMWEYAESVLVDGRLAICTPGGKDNTIVALDKTDGNVVWASAIGDQAGYSSVIKATIDGVDQYINLTAKGVISVRAENGKFLWRYDAPANDRTNITTCITTGNSIFAATAYSCGGGRVDITRSGDKFDVKEVFFNKKIQNHHGGMVLVDGMLYGCSNPKDLMCVDFNIGGIKWSDKRAGKCAVLYADGMLYCRDENGPISLVEARPDGFNLKGKFSPPGISEKNSWAHLVISNGKLYIRDQNTLFCYEVKKIVDRVWISLAERFRRE